MFSNMYYVRKTICGLLSVAAGPVFLCAQATVLNECTRALYREDYLQVEHVAQKHLQKNPFDVSVRVILARAELAEGKLRPAFEDLRKAVAADPHNVDALYYLSFATRAMSQQEYQRLFAMAPDSSRVHQLLAESAFESQDPAQAEAEFRKALDANPRSAEVATELAELKRSQSKFDEAITYYSQALQTDATNYVAVYGLGACYTYKQEYKQAVEWLRKAVALAPDSAAGHFALGNALFQSGSLEPAIPELKTSLQLEPGIKQAYFLLGRAYTKLGRKEEAAAAFKKLDELSGSPGQRHSSEPR
jgi:protein O-GlcNAc transferase